MLENFKDLIDDPSMGSIQYTDYPIFAIGDVCAVGDGAHAKVKRCTTGILYLTSKNINSGYLDLNNVDYISQEDYDKFFPKNSKATRRPEPGDVLMGIIGTFGNSYLYKSTDHFGVSSSVAILRPNQSVLNPSFLYYVVSSKSFKEVHNAYKGGSVQGYTNISTIKHLPIPLPPLSQQKAIASLLTILDSKIELNKRMNETLEGIAQALFKSWFIDFDPVKAKAEGRNLEGIPNDFAALFPNSFEEGRPKGWSEKSIYSCAEYINGAAYKNIHFSDAQDALPVIKIAELKDGIGQGTKYTNIDLGKKYLINTGEILFSWSGSPETSIDTFLWVGGAAWLNQHIFRVVTQSPETRTFVFFLLKQLKPIFIAAAKNKQTTGLGHVTIQDLKRLKFIYPSIEVLRVFADITTPILERFQSNLEQIALLSSLRNELLPKLISGELRVSEINEIEKALAS